MASFQELIPNLESLRETLFNSQKESAERMAKCSKFPFFMNLPSHSVLAIVKQMETKDFLMMYRSSKWVYNLITERRKDFVKNIENSWEIYSFCYRNIGLPKGSFRATPFKDSVEGLKRFKQEAEKRNHFKFAVIILYQFQTKEHVQACVDFLTKIKYRISCGILDMDCFRDATKSFLEYFKPNELSSRSFGPNNLDVSIMEFPKSLNKITLYTCKRQDIITLISRLFGTKITVEFNFSIVMFEETSLIWDLLHKEMKANPCENNIQIVSRPLSGRETAEFILIPADAIYKFRRQNSEKGFSWKYQITLEKAGKGAICMIHYLNEILPMDNNSNRNGAWHTKEDFKINWIQNMEQFKKLFEGTVLCNRKSCKLRQSQFFWGQDGLDCMDPEEESEFLNIQSILNEIEKEQLLML